LPFFAAPSAEALRRVSAANYLALLDLPSFHRALINSLVLAIASASAVTLLTALIAWIVYKSRLRGAWLLDFLAFLPIAVPGLVLGMALIWFYVAFPLPICGTIWVLLVAYATKYLPFGMRAASGSMVQVHRQLEEAGSAAGGSWWQVFRRVTLPLLRPGLAAGWIYICIISFREFSTSVLLVTGQSTVLSILIFSLFEQGQPTLVAAIGMVMIAVLATVVLAFYKLSGRIGIQAS
ncbi:MAG TPA: ABC transporter permease subunit, partial [Chloroflexota bacterium]|nr:ABC transporter permease subunit [Chloroflexota bacterium]